MAASACGTGVSSYFFVCFVFAPRPFGERLGEGPAFLPLLCVCLQRPGLAPAGEFLFVRDKKEQKSASATLPAKLAALLRRSAQTAAGNQDFYFMWARRLRAPVALCHMQKGSDSVFASFSAGLYSFGRNNMHPAYRLNLARCPAFSSGAQFFMAVSGIAKVQHYVPQFLLRKFGNGKKDQLYVFDKHTSRSFPSNAKNVASESRFYDFKIGQHEATLEPKLAELERAVKPLLDRILEKDSVSVLSDSERELIASFLAVQFTRTKAFREQLIDLPRMLGEHLRSHAGDQEDLGGISEFLKMPDENELKVQVASIMMNAPKDFGPHFLNKDWFLIATTHKAPFIIGDHPLALQNAIEMGPYGNLGVAVRGIEIYLPLSPIRALAMWCPSHRQTILEAAHTLRTISTIAPHLVAQKIRDPEGVEHLARVLTDGTPLRYSLENVKNFNSLQVRYAERFVFSCTSEFSLPQEMVNSHPSIRRGMRMRWN